ncbi:SRPBCC family protein [Plantactinospora sp. GCM10030261]|uniref:SRPBCC family protein n=1 Tax=Plantactinospora sp. GCM10030261 TaxID=3273420 RepID=UPI0036225A37
MRYATEVTINAPAEDVWRVLADVRRWPDWTPTVRRVDQLDDGPLRFGSRIRIEQPRLRPAVMTVTKFEPGRSFVWASTSSAVRAVADHRVVEGPSGTVVTLTFDLDGWMAPVARAAYGGLIQRYVTTEGESLKRHCETR